MTNADHLSLVCLAASTVFGMVGWLAWWLENRPPRRR